MKITKTKLKEIIKEELDNITEMEREYPSDIMADENVVDNPNQAAVDFLVKVAEKNGMLTRDRVMQKMSLLPSLMMDGSIEGVPPLSNEEFWSLVDQANKIYTSEVSHEVPEPDPDYQEADPRPYGNLGS